MLIAMAGLPGSGKSTLAGRLVSELAGVFLSKDVVRAALFPPPVLDYSTAQDDLVMEAIFKAAAFALGAVPQRTVILDGRTFLRAYQVRDLLDLATRLNQPVHVVECVCDDALAKERLELDQTRRQHPAGNRTYQLYMELKLRAEPITVPHLTLDTGRLTPETCVERCLEYVKAGPINS